MLVLIGDEDMLTTAGATKFAITPGDSNLEGPTSGPIAPHAGATNPQPCQTRTVSELSAPQIPGRGAHSSSLPPLIAGLLPEGGFGPARGTKVGFTVGPISSDCRGTICSLDRSCLYGVFGDMTKVPAFTPSNPNVKNGRHYVTIEATSGDKPGLKHVCVEYWKRAENKRFGATAALVESLDIAKKLGSKAVLVALPNCSSQPSAMQELSEFDSAPPGGLSDGDITELTAYLEGVRRWAQDNPKSSIKNITLVWGEAFAHQLDRPLDQVMPERREVAVPPLPHHDETILDQLCTSLPWWCV